MRKKTWLALAGLVAVLACAIPSAAQVHSATIGIDGMT